MEEGLILMFGPIAFIFILFVTLAAYPFDFYTKDKQQERKTA